MARLNGLEATETDVFCETAWLLDYLLARPDISQHQVDSLWVMLVNRIRSWKPDVTDNDKLLVASTVFLIVRVTLTQHFESIYREGICSLLNHTLERETESRPGEEQAVFLQLLTDQIPLLCEWINGYDEAGEWLSDEIENAIKKGGKAHSKEKKTTFTPTGKTFTKTVQVSNLQLRIIAQRLSVANKLDSSCTAEKWEKLFSGVNSNFTIKWLGKPGELRDLFKMLTRKREGADSGYIIPFYGFQQIIQSHFTDENGNYFKDIRKQKHIADFDTIINDCEFFIQNYTEQLTDVMKSIILEHDRELREYGYVFNLSTFKREGLKVSNRRH